MTALLATDHSDLNLWGWKEWALLGAAMVFVLAAGWWHAYRTAPVMEPEVSGLDRLDGLGRCVMAHCNATATIERVTVAEVGLEIAHVCPGCSDAGDFKGWWLT